MESILQMLYYTGQNANKYTVIYDFAVAIRCLSNLGIHASISFTPTIKNASLLKHLRGDFQSLLQPHWERTGSLCNMGGRAGGGDMTCDIPWFILRPCPCGGSRDVGKGPTVFFPYFIKEIRLIRCIAMIICKVMLVPCNTKFGAAVVNKGLLSIPLVANFSLVAWAGRPTTRK